MAEDTIGYYMGREGVVSVALLFGGFERVWVQGMWY
jgi:hypothetical protein